nr:SAM-dependent methyltransferase [Clostridia bacterium]
MRDECLICKAPLEYLQSGTEMECTICHKKEESKTRCVSGHFVCNECHMRGMDAIFALCMAETSANPLCILEKMMSLEFCHMHGPEHHVMVGAALLTAYRNAGGGLNLEKALLEMYKRGKQVPGGACGFWGACGAGISAGMFVSIATGSTPLAQEAWGLSNQMTGRALTAIGQHGGPRCCKRDSYIAVREAVAFAAEKLHVQMETSQAVCTRSAMNHQCIGAACPFAALTAQE